jgi:hypothetical protein
MREGSTMHGFNPRGGVREQLPRHEHSPSPKDARATHFDLTLPDLPDGARASGREAYAPFRNVGTGLLPCAPDLPTEIGDDFR